MKTNNLYPLFLKLDQIQTLIVGGGDVGLEKINFILKQSPKAKIKLVSETFHPDLSLRALKLENIELIKRKFIPQDLTGIKVLIVATNRSDTNMEIYQLAQSKNILTNVVDHPELCDFYTAAVMKKGAIQIAVSTNGASPTLAKRLRDVLEEVIPNEVEVTVEMLTEIRTLLKEDLQEKIEILNSLTTVLSPKNRHYEKLNGAELLKQINLN